MKLSNSSVVLVFVVVELSAGNDFTGNRCPWCHGVAEHRNFDLACNNAFFKHDPFVVAKRIIDCSSKFSACRYLRYANRRTHIGGLDENRKSKSSTKFVKHGFAPRTSEFLGMHAAPICLSDSFSLGDLLGDDLVHRHRRTENR